MLIKLSHAINFLVKCQSSVRSHFTDAFVAEQEQIFLLQRCGYIHYISIHDFEMKHLKAHMDVYSGGHIIL